MKDLALRLRKSLASVGWFILFLFLVAGSSSVVRGSIFGPLFFGSLSVAWLYLAWKTLAKWFNRTIATSALAALLLLYFFAIYLAWLGRH